MALSNRWLLVPIAEAAVSAAVGSDRRGSRITCGGKVQLRVAARPWPDQPGRWYRHLRVAYECRGAERGSAGAGRWAALAANYASILSVLQQG